MVAATILLTAATGLMSVFAVAFKTNRWQGDASTRTIEYAQDKMEALLGLSFGDSSSDTTQSPTCTVYSNPACTLTAPNNTGLGGAMAASTTVGGTNWQSPVSGYVDYLDSNGQQLTTSSGASYTRVWSIRTDSTGNLKMITVVAVASPKTALNPATTTLVCLKNNQ